MDKSVLRDSKSEARLRGDKGGWGLGGVEGEERKARLSGERQKRARKKKKTKWESTSWPLEKAKETEKKGRYLDIQGQRGVFLVKKKAFGAGEENKGWKKYEMDTNHNKRDIK